MAATVEGVFRIIDRATGPMRRMERQAIMTDKAISRLGKDLDQVGSPQQLRGLQNTERQLRNIDRQSQSTFRQGARDTDRFSRSLRGAGRETDSLWTKIIRLGVGIASLNKIRQALMIPALGAAIGFLAQAIGGLAANAIALTPAIVDLGGALGALPATLVGIGTAMIAVKLATADLGKALGGNKNALKELTPEARRFVRTLQMYKPVLQDLRREAQRGLFPGLDTALRRAQRAVPTLRGLMRQGGQVVGNLAAQASERLTTPQALRDLNMVGRQGLSIVSRLGTGALNLADALIDVTIAARPFTNWLTNTIVGWTKWVRGAAQAGRESGRLELFFRRSQRSLTLFGHIMRDIFFVLRDVGRASRDTGDSMWASAEKAVRGWRRWTSSLGGQIRMTRMFQDTREILGETVGLVGDLGGALFRMGQQPGVAGLIAQIRTWVPALERFLDTAVTVYGPVLADLVGSLIRLLEIFIAATGKINIFLQVLADVLGLFTRLVDTIPPLKGALMALFTVVSIGLFTRKLIAVVGGMFGLTRATQAATAAQMQLNAAQAGGVATGAVGRAGLIGGMFGFGGGRGSGLAARVGNTRAGYGLLGAGLAARGRLGGLATRVGNTRAGYGLLGAGLRAGGMLGRVGSPLGIATLIGATGLSMVPGVPRGVANTAGTIGTYAGIGALAGSVIPGIGTGVGALLGGGVGAVRAALSHRGPSQAERAQRSLGAYQGVLQGMGGDDPTMRQLRQQVAFLHRAVKDYANASTDSGRVVQAALQRELKTRGQVLRTQEQQIAMVRRAKAVETANKLLPQFGREFNMLRGRVGVEGAMQTTVGDIISRMNQLPEAGRGIIASASLKWAAEAARQNPKLRGQYERLKDAVLKSFRTIYENAQIFNNRILTGSQSQWKAIGNAMSGPVEQARQRITAQFTYIQREAIAAMMAMGVGRGDARAIVSGMESGRITAGQAGAAGKYGVSAGALLSPHASGGRIPGRGLQDSVPVGSGALAAPGELIVNRHTENRVNRALAHQGTSLGREVGRETRGHSLPMGGASTGGRSGSYVLGGVRPGIRSLAEAVLNAFPSLMVTSTTGGDHAKNSYHYRGMAVDIGGPQGVMDSAGGWVGANMTPRLLEGIHNPNLSVKFGRTVPAGYWGPTTWAGHRDHLHLAAGGGSAALGDFGPVGAAMRQIGPLGFPAYGRGVAGALSYAVGRSLARGMRGRINAMLAAQGGVGASTGLPGGGSNSANRALAHRMMLQGGWPEPQWDPLNSLWTKESGFDAMARNPSSGAFGIPQALPASKMGPAGVAGDPVAQIAWGLNYIRGRYGSPGAAWAHSQAHNWYGMGGRLPFAGWHKMGGRFTVNRPTLFGAGDGARPETVTIGRRGLETSAGGVNIGRIVVHNNRPGDIRRQIETEVEEAFTNLAHTLTGMPMEGDEDLA